MKHESISINPHMSQPTSFLSLVKSVFCNRQLIIQMTRREVIGRYKGSIAGLAWSFFNPILMLSVYTLVFSIIFKARWGVDVEENKIQFAMILFLGIIVFSLFNEVLNRAPALILMNVNYVKKVIFPIEILPIISIGAALFHCLISLCVFMVSFVIFNGQLHWTMIYVPLILFPLIVLSLGLSWILASLGVFIRDVGQTIAMLTTLLMFLSPVFYPISAVPLHLQNLILVNPLSFIIEELRAVIIWGQQPSWIGLGFYLFISILIMWFGYIWFQKTRKGFSDVL